MEDMNFLQQEISRKDFDQFFKGVDEYLDLHGVNEEDIESNQDYELEARILKEKDDLTIDDCIWLESNYLKRKGIILVNKDKSNIEVRNFFKGISLASFEFSEEDLNDSYIKIVKLCLDFLCLQD